MSVGCNLDVPRMLARVILEGFTRAIQKLFDRVMSILRMLIGGGLGSLRKNADPSVFS